MRSYILALSIVLIIIAASIWYSRGYSEKCCFIACNSDDDCGNWQCSNHACIPCNSDSDCVGNMIGSRCITDSNGYPQCVRCLIDADCTGGKICVENGCYAP
jgi:hypothetical protein